MDIIEISSDSEEDEPEIVERHPDQPHLNGDIIFDDENALPPNEMYEERHGNVYAFMQDDLFNNAGPDERADRAQDVQPDEAICRQAVLVIFPKICPIFLETTCEELSWSSEHVIARILDDIENDKPYPVNRQQLKRKRISEDEGRQCAERYSNAQRRMAKKCPEYRKTCEQLLAKEYTLFYKDTITKAFRENSFCLYPTVVALNKAIDEGDDENRPYRLKTRPVGHSLWDDPVKLESIEKNAGINPGVREALEEYMMAKKNLGFRATQYKPSKRQAAAAEAHDLAEAKQKNMAMECDCCCEEFPVERMVHCDSEKEMHWACKGCAKQAADTEIGQSRYKLKCITGDGCEGVYPKDQREKFLDAKSTAALENIEQTAMIREAGIQHISHCPFCDFAAECPPIEEDWEFRCQNTECENVSCRRCNKLSHAPLSCEEHAQRTNGEHARHKIEEAMTAALIRNCNKCKNPFVKIEGCNKMTCPSCNNVQCYVCNVNCTYDHFEGRGSGGKCPLYDGNGGVEERHRAEVDKAEEAARAKVQDENPDVNPEGLKFKMAADVDRPGRMGIQRMHHMPPPMFGIPQHGYEEQMRARLQQIDAARVRLMQANADRIRQPNGNDNANQRAFDWIVAHPIDAVVPPMLAVAAVAPREHEARPNMPRREQAVRPRQESQLDLQRRAAQRQALMDAQRAQQQAAQARAQERLQAQQEVARRDGDERRRQEARDRERREAETRRARDMVQVTENATRFATNMLAERREEGRRENAKKTAAGLTPADVQRAWRIGDLGGQIPVQNGQAAGRYDLPRRHPHVPDVMAAAMRRNRERANQRGAQVAQAATVAATRPVDAVRAAQDRARRMVGR